MKNFSVTLLMVFLLQAVYEHLGYISVDVPIVNIPLMVQKTSY